jgi:hypothetical protein
MFEFFENTVGVANIEGFAARMKFLPRYVTKGRGGQGFVEFTRLVLRG